MNGGPDSSRKRPIEFRQKEGWLDAVPRNEMRIVPSRKAGVGSRQARLDRVINLPLPGLAEEIRPAGMGEAAYMLKRYRVRWSVSSLRAD